MGHIRARNLGKAYKRYPSKWSRIAEWIYPQRERHQKRWVLRGMDFEVAPGESVGIIGHNGAGKSTLLKIISGTTQPTEGSIEIGAPIAALLELGMGFHPDFTGRQNAYMGGQLRGLSSEQVTELIPAIEAFAEIGDYIDQPLRTYSSGMQVRLAFSVATCVRPGILIVDEALSVGDAYFQHKSFARIRQFHEEGTTLLFVSHDPGAVKTLCERAILLDGGCLVREGDPEAVLSYYNAVIARQEADHAIREVETASGRIAFRSGNQKAVIKSCDLLEKGETARAVLQGAEVEFAVDIEVHEPIDELTVGMLIRDRLGNDVFGTNSFHLDTSASQVLPGSLRFVFAIPQLLLGVGNYSVTFALHSLDAHIADNYDWWDQALAFQVVPGNWPRGVGVALFPVAGRWVNQAVANHRHANDRNS